MEGELQHRSESIIEMKDTKSILYGLVALMLLICLLELPYGAYILIRFIAVIAFCYFAYSAHQSDNEARMVLFIVLALLVQPFFRLPLGRGIWIIVDVVIASYLLYLAFKKNN